MADTVTKVDDNTVKIGKVQEQNWSYELLLKQKLRLEGMLADVNFHIAEAIKLGVGPKP